MQRKEGFAGEISTLAGVQIPPQSTFISKVIGGMYPDRLHRKAIFKGAEKQS